MQIGCYTADASVTSDYQELALRCCNWHGAGWGAWMEPNDDFDKVEVEQIGIDLSII